MVTLTLMRPVYRSIDPSTEPPIWEVGHVATVLSYADEMFLMSFDSMNNRVDVGLTSANHFFGEKEVMIAILKL